MTTVFFLSCMLLTLGTRVKASARTLYPVLITGANEWKSSTNGASSIKKIIKKNGFTDKTASIKSVSYKSSKYDKKRADRIHTAITKGMKKAKSGDIGFFYYIGHGSENGIVIKNYQPHYAELSYSKLAKWLSQTKCGKIIVVMDACHSENFYNKGVKSLSAKNQKRFICFLACCSNETAQTISSKYSRFTRAFCAGLGVDGTVYADKNNNGKVTAGELADYINNRVKNDLLYTPDAKPYWDDQNPKAYGANKNYIVFKYKGTSIKLGKSSTTINKGKTETLHAIVSGAKASDVKWKSSNKKIATVSSKGVVKGVNKGKATITAYIGKKTAKCKVTVKAIKTVGTLWFLSSTNLTIPVGGMDYLTATADGIYQNTEWKISDSSVAKVKSNGLGECTIKGLKPGTAVITATVNGTQRKCKLTVKARTTAVPTSSLDVNLAKYIGKSISTAHEQLPKLPYDKSYGGRIRGDYIEINGTNGKVTSISIWCGNTAYREHYSIYGVKPYVMDKSKAEAKLQKAGFKWKEVQKMNYGKVDYYKNSAGLLVTLYTNEKGILGQVNLAKNN